MLSIAFWMRKYALQQGEGYDPATGQTNLRDRGFRRMMRGFMARRWYVNVFNVLYTGGALALAGLGAYSAIEVLINAFKSSRTTSFVCKSPLDSS